MKIKKVDIINLSISLLGLGLGFFIYELMTDKHYIEVFQHLYWSALGMITYSIINNA